MAKKCSGLEIKLKLKTVLHAAIALSALTSGMVLAQTYPVKPIRIVVGFVPGGGTDSAARLLAQRLPDVLGQQVIVENRPGAGGMIAGDIVAKASADGYTLLMTSAPDAVLPALRKEMPYDIMKDFTHVSLVATGPFVLVVHPVVPARTVKEFIALARAQPGKLNFASSGVGSSGHISGELFNVMAKIKVVHVPYKGSAEGVSAAAGGEVDMVFAPVATAQALGSAGKVRALGISSRERFPTLPDVPTINESGLPGFERYGWYGLTASAQTPRDIVLKLNAAVVKAVNTPALLNAFINQGMLPKTGTPKQFTAFIRDEVAQSAKVVKASGATGS
jgi:tripartite-type tricarboxylate transporter receptor subunit TctC